MTYFPSSVGWPPENVGRVLGILFETVVGGDIFDHKKGAWRAHPGQGEYLLLHVPFFFPPELSVIIS